MKRYFLFLAVLSVVLIGCFKPTNAESSNENHEQDSSVVKVDQAESSFPKRVCNIPLPKGYDRVVLDDTASFAYFLRHLPLKPEGSPVMTYDGYEAGTTDVAYAVIDTYGPSNENIQQCADAIIRLRAEWLYQNKRYDEIAFHFTNGWLCEYKRWADGERVRVEGNKTSWYKAFNSTDYSYSTFQQYLRMVFYYAGTLSLEKELRPASITDIQIGDVFIKGGSPGHSIIVVDVALKSEGEHKGERCFIVAESYMPAQDIHILKNVNKGFENISPWYFIDEIIRNGEYDYNFASYSFSGLNLKCF